MNIDKVFYICAAVCFALEAFGVASSVQKTPLGFMFLTLSLIF